MRIISHIILLTALCLFTACKGVALDERFHSQNLSNWTLIDDLDTVEGPSEWQVEGDGWLHQRSNIWGRRGDFLGRWYGTYIVAGDEGWNDYEFKVKALPQDGDGFGVVFRFKDKDHFYRLIFIQDGLNGGPLARLDKRDGEDFTELWSSKQGYEVGREMLIEVEVEGDSISALVNGRVLFEIKDSSYNRGKIGLFCYAQSNQAFDEVRVVEK
jgi:hypothetical protein